ncbi:MAG: glutathionylspermidine synthase family protein [Bacteroidota bacterium]|nr:glutathionylspermidine synthase family protein [Bacteroidota bacterium]
MRRIKCKTRDDWKKKVEEIGFGFHSIGDVYWDETAYYSFNMSQVEVLEQATQELFDRCLDAVQHVIDHKLYSLFHIPEQYIPLIEQSWNDDLPSIYGRFDFAYDGVNPPKMLEFNADTPTSLFEASVVQWFWLEDIQRGSDQFNSIHEKLIAYWKYLKDYLHKGPLYFCCLKDNEEDLTTVEYLRDCAIQAGLETEFIYLEDIGWDTETQSFVDMECRPIPNLFKLYPWEWLINEEFGKHILTSATKTIWIEPAWKILLSSKAILPILWKLFPDHPNLLPAYFESTPFKYDFVKKPIYSREGENVTIVKMQQVLAQTYGNYGEEGYIFQQYNPLPEFEYNYTVVGSWVIGCEPAGIGIRESKSLITDNLSRFVPHIIS